jgi:hypothetical protein
MTSRTLGAHMGAAVTIDACLTCQAFWFDGHESLRLTPVSTLQLFRLIGEQATPRPRGNVSSRTACPRCSAPLQLTQDMQRTTRFQYRRCPRNHGRFIAFFDFLREKNFIRPLTPAQIDELRRNVASVNCSNCGAPVDLARTSACSHCASPLSMLDLKQAETLITQLREADRAGDVDPAMALNRERARREVEQAFASFEREPTWYAESSSMGSVSAGLAALGRWLAKNR